MESGHERLTDEVWNSEDFLELREEWANTGEEEDKVEWPDEHSAYPWIYNEL
jgi:hypothetical protein